MQQLARFEKTFEQYDPAVVPGIAQLSSGIDIQHRVAIRFRERGRCPREAVTIGIRLDYGQHASTWIMATRNGEIRTQRGAVDQCTRRAGHASMPCRLCATRTR